MREMREVANNLLWAPDAPNFPVLPTSSETIVESVLRDLPVGFILFDRRGRVLRISNESLRRFRAKASEVLERQLSELFAYDAKPLALRALDGEILERESWCTLADGEQPVWIRDVWYPLRNLNGGIVAGLVLSVDATNEKRAQEAAHRFATFDMTTGLANRRTFTAQLGRLLDSDQAETGLAVVWLNIDRFKSINTAFGMRAADHLLQTIAARLSERLRPDEFVARAGADNFLLLVPMLDSRQATRSLMSRIDEVFAEPFTINDEEVFVTTSAGIALTLDGDQDAAELEEAAHLAMRDAKSRGGGRWQIHTEHHNIDAAHEIRLANAIRTGLAAGEFVTFYQPQIDLATNEVVGFEALARWLHPTRGIVSPAEFIPFCEETGLIEDLGAVILSRACSDVCRWRRRYGLDLSVSVNVSPRELHAEDIGKRILAALAESGLPAHALDIEITESAVLVDAAHAHFVTTQLHAAGVTLSLDDFGTGYSSLTHLHQLPIDRVKLDWSFVANSVVDQSAAAITEGITVLARALGKTVIAEGVETSAEVGFVTDIGCHLAQGYFFSRPLDRDSCDAYLAVCQNCRLAE